MSDTVLSSIPVYFLTVFEPKKWAITKLDKIRRAFLWKGTTEANSAQCLVAWDKIKRPKLAGGLGVLDLEKFIRALRLRWLWFKWTDPDRPWWGMTFLVMRLISSFSDAQQLLPWEMVA